MTRAAFTASLAVATLGATHKEHRSMSATLADLQNPASLRARTRAIDIWGISRHIATRTSIRPDQIETFSEAEHTRVTDKHGIEGLYAALEHSKPVATKQLVEYRWKVVAYDAGGERIAEIYASPIAPFGMVGETPFHFSNDAFVEHLAKTLDLHDLKPTHG